MSAVFSGKSDVATSADPTEIERLHAKMGLSPIDQKPKTSEPHPEHRVDRYLRKGLMIGHPNQAWCSDITDIPMCKDFL